MGCMPYTLYPVIPMPQGGGGGDAPERALVARCMREKVDALLRLAQLEVWPPRGVT